MRSGNLYALVLVLTASAPALAQNLVVNGDFETGTSTGWSTWNASWGPSVTQNFNNTESGKNGNFCLRLNTTGQSSFGVYQQITTIPGHTYRIDAYWKGTQHGATNWYEILLIDGPFSMQQADDGDPASVFVEPNYMYAYDNNTFPLPGSFGWIWAHDQNAPPNDEVDWNNRMGERTAGGTTMTIVLKAGACCGTNGSTAWFDDVCMVDVTAGGTGCADPSGGSSGDCTSFKNGDFTDGMNNWTTWTRTGTPSVSVNGSDELVISGTGSHDGGAYQQFNTGGAGTVINVIGSWRANIPGANSEVYVINEDRIPVNGVNEVDGVNNAILLYKNSDSGGWDGPMPKNALDKFQISFVANDPKATILIRESFGGLGFRELFVDDIAVHCVPPTLTLSSIPNGFEVRTATFNSPNWISLGQSPTSKKIYAVRNDQFTGNTDVYRIDVDGGSISPNNFITSLATDDAQGLTFDDNGNIYISTRLGEIWKGTDTNGDPNIDSFSFTEILDLPDLQIGTFHGVGGIDVGPDNLLYINSGSESHYGKLSNGSLEQYGAPPALYNAQILRCSLNGGIGTVEQFCNGNRNTFDITFREDGVLFGVENGPNTNCDYAEEFNRLDQGEHYGFPYYYGDDVGGADRSIACNNGDGGGPGPVSPPPDFTSTPAWANYGPDGKPGPGQIGEQDSSNDVYYGFHPHSSPDGIDFYEPNLMDPAAIKFPVEFYGRAFVARFGDLEPSLPATVGRDVLSLRLDDDHEGFISNTFFDNIGRAIDVLCAHNGKVYILEFTTDTSGINLPGPNSRIIEIAYTIPGDGPVIALNKATISNEINLGDSLANDSFTVTNVLADTLEYDINITYNTSETGWLMVSPDSGSSTGESDPITVSYPTAGTMPAGTHQATISVEDPEAGNSPQSIAVTLLVKSVLPDFDNDGDVDMDDHAFLQACYSSSPGLAPPAGCAIAAMDNDVDVDQNDLNIFRACFSGKNVPVINTCDDPWE